jgi:hypothetical protein
MPHRSDLFSPPTRQRTARANSLLSWIRPDTLMVRLGD